MTSNNKNLCVDKPEIKEVFELETGEYYTAQQAIGNDYNNLIQLRMELSERINNNNPKYVCPLCHVAVSIRCNRTNKTDDKKFSFKHRVENGNCPAITRGTLSKEQIEAIKYNGAKESPAHIRMKEIIAESLEQDPDFTNIKPETVIKGADRKSWRKPDIQALWKGKLRVAFEVQLSTTFLEVIAQRRLFYKAENSLVCWVFKKFDKENALMTQDDIFHNNNQNLFLASEDTLKSSIQNKGLMLNCHWHEPTIQNNKIADIWNSKYVKFKELEYDLDKQSIYYFDYKSEKEKLIPKPKVNTEISVEEIDTEDLKMRFDEWWCSHNEKPSNDDDWKSFRYEFNSEDIFIPEYPYKIEHLLNGLYSAKYGKAIGSKQTKLIEVAHLIANLKSDLSVLQTFRVALLVYNRGSQIVEEDKSGKWKSRSSEFRKHIYEEKYKRDMKLDDLISFLFPLVMNKAVWNRLKAIDEKHNLNNP